MELPMADGPDKEMWLAVIEQDLGRLESALQSGANANLVDEQNMAPVMLAAMLYNLEAVKLLGAHGARYPQDVQGRQFEVYFDVPEPWFSPHEMWSAERVAVHRRDVELLDALLTLPGALDELAKHGSIADYISRPCYAHKVLTKERDPTLLLPILHNAAAKTLAADHPLSDGESKLLGFVVKRFMAPLLKQSYDPFWIKVQSTAEYIRDAGYAVPGQDHVIRSLAFGIEGSGAHHPITANATEEVTGIIAGGYDSANIDVGIVQLSSNAWVRMAACTYENPDAIYERKDVKERTGAAYLSEDDDYYIVAGTVFFSTERRALERHMRLLGPARLALDLAVAVHADRYEETKTAINAGADTAMTCFGEITADVLAAYCSSPNALRAVLESDPVARAKLSTERFTFDSPLRKAIETATMNDLKITDYNTIFPYYRRALAQGYPKQRRGLETVTVLISAGANVNVKDSVASPLEKACLLRSTDLVEKLLEAGADPTDIIEGKSLVSDKISEATAILLHSWRARQTMQKIAPVAPR